MLPLYRRSTGRQSNPSVLSDGKCSGAEANRLGSLGDSDKPSSPDGAEGRGDAKEVEILSKGSGPTGFVQLGWRGEFSAWRQAGPGVRPHSGISGKSGDRE